MGASIDLRTGTISYSCEDCRAGLDRRKIRRFSFQVTDDAGELLAQPERITCNSCWESNWRDRSSVVA